ncbi:MAG TPA: hypothetical protein VMQ61_06150 [Thermoanaerobaculia bacterium]|nr:hypothetical protein [Thermoanaerobaculia bacterium]
MRFSKTADHEVVEIILRQEPAPGGRIALRDPVGEQADWIVIDCRPDPHGWMVRAVRCLPDCREHSGTGGGP